MDYDVYQSPMGPLWLAGESGVLTVLSFTPLSGAPDEQDSFAPVKRWLDDYFAGRFRSPDFPMAPEGTPFQKLVWSLLLQVPAGQTETYGALAKKCAAILGKERMSAQAIGQAVGRNPIAIIIPCHRILGVKGQMTGYAYGLDRKTWLLQHEGSIS